jgi:dATP pyrophosphohydrolase
MPAVESTAVEVFVFKETNGVRKYLILKRSDKVVYPGIWSVCAGSIEQGERSHETAIRELKEETGLELSKLYIVDSVNSFYDYEGDKIFILPLFVAEINNGEVVLNDEHSEFLWLDAESVKKQLHWISHKRNIDLIEKCFKDEEYFRTLKQII